MGNFMEVRISTDLDSDNTFLPPPLLLRAVSAQKIVLELKNPDRRVIVDAKHLIAAVSLLCNKE